MAVSLRVHRYDFYNATCTMILSDVHSSLPEVLPTSKSGCHCIASRQNKGSVSQCSLKEIVWIWSLGLLVFQNDDVNVIGKMSQGNEFCSSGSEGYWLFSKKM